MSGTALLAASVLADSDKGKGSPIGFFVVLVLVIAVYFLYRSMSRHIKNVPAEFPPPGTATGQRTEPPATAEQPDSPVED